MQTIVWDGAIILTFGTTLDVLCSPGNVRANALDKDITDA